MIWRKMVLATPLIILAVGILLAENYRQASNLGPSTQTLHIVGYSYNRHLVQLSVTLWNKGDESLIISGVIYDDVRLSMGLIGPAIDHAFVGAGNNPGSAIPANDLIFAAADHWNMDTMGPGTPVIQPNGIATLYLGVTSTDPGSKHLLQIVTVGQEYVFTLEFGG